MIFQWFILSILSSLDRMNASWGQAMDVHLNTNNYFLAALYYMRTLDQFLPITDAVIPLVLLSFTIQNGFTIFRIVRFVKSFIPSISGSG